MKAYENFVKQAEGKSQDERKVIAREMKELHDGICKGLYEAGNKEEIGEHVKAYNTAKSILIPKRARPKISMTATNVYDNDDRPTNY